MSDYLDEIDNILKSEQPAEAPAPEAPPAPDFSQYDAKIAEMEARMAEITEKNRKLTQYALGEPVQQEDYNARIKDALENNPLGYTKEVVDTATNQTMAQVNKRLQEQQDTMAAQQAIESAKQKYPVLSEHQEVIGLYADKVLNDINTGVIKDVKPNEYGKIIDKAVQLFNHKYGYAAQRSPHHVMSLDVGTQQNTAYGTNSLSDILNLPDDKFLQVADKIQRGQQFQF